MLCCNSSLISLAIAAFILAAFGMYASSIQGILGDILPSRPCVLSQMMALTGVFGAMCNGAGYVLGIAMLYLKLPTLVPFLLQSVCIALALLCSTSLPETLDKVTTTRRTQAVSDAFSAVYAERKFSWNVCKGIR